MMAIYICLSLSVVLKPSVNNSLKKRDVSNELEAGPFNDE